MPSKLSIIIPVYNEEKDIENFIKFLKNKIYKNFEIIIVDDGSTDNTKKIIKKYKEMKLIVGGHKGPGFSRNLGAKNAQGEILIFIDADMTFDKNYLKNLIKPILEDKKIIGTTHESEIANNTEKNIWSKCWGKDRITFYYKENPKIFRAIRKSKFLEMGGFDPKYGYADDQTFWYKFGIKPIIAPNTICYHNNPETLEKTFYQAKWIGTSWKERFGIFRIKGINYFVLFGLWTFIPLLVVVKSLKTKIENVKNLDKMKFYWYKFYGYYEGVKKAIIKEEFGK